MAIPHTSAAFSATLRVHLDNRPGAFARLAAAVGEAGGSLDAIDIVRLEHGKKVRDVTVLAIDEAHIARIMEAVGGRTASTSRASPTGLCCSTGAGSSRSPRGCR